MAREAPQDDRQSALPDPASGTQGRERTGKRHRLAVVTSHPIQYQAPLFRELARRPEVDLTVFFCSDHGLTERLDPGFGQSFKWDVPLVEGYRYELLPNRSPHPGPENGFLGEFNPALLPRLARGGFDAVLVHGYAYASCWLAFAAAKLGGARLLMRAEAHLLEPRPRWKRAAKAAILRPAFKIVDAGLAIGTLNHEYYRHYGISPLKLVHAPYSVDNDYFAAEADRWRATRTAIRRELGLPEDVPVVLFCGKLIPKKRPLDLLEALSRTSRVPPIHALVVGDGLLRPECETFVRSKLPGRVAFAGFQNQASLPKMYAAADLLVLPSEIEPWGLVVNEAMASGLPAVVSTAVGAAADLVRPGETGDIFTVGDVEALARSLEAICRPEKLRACSVAARERMARWSLRETADGIVRALEG